MVVMTASLLIGVIAVVIILALVGRFKEGQDDMGEQEPSGEGGQEDRDQERDRHYNHRASGKE
jgi:hypothetical protein